MVSQAFELKSALESGNIDDFGALLNEGWKLKKSLATAISNPRIDHYYELAITQGGAYGGKLLGAGSGGYLLFYCIPEHQEKLRNALSDLQELSFSLTRTGSEVIYYDV
jgi:D-glycero-alpha-D-manno-heptose-7-phosphate kinase